MRSRISGVTKDRSAVFSMLDILDRYHGQPTGVFTCDEHLAAAVPPRGPSFAPSSSPCTPLKWRLVSPATRLGDRLEMLAFNALPATFKKDMTAHQYDQQCNQVVSPLPAITCMSATRPTPIFMGSSRILVAARPTCTRAGRSSPPSSGCEATTAGWPPLRMHHAL